MTPCKSSVCRLRRCNGPRLRWRPRSAWWRHPHRSWLLVSVSPRADWRGEGPLSPPRWKFLQTWHVLCSQSSTLLCCWLMNWVIPLLGDLTQAAKGVELEGSWHVPPQDGIHKHPVYQCPSSGFSRQNELLAWGRLSQESWGGPHLRVEVLALGLHSDAPFKIFLHLFFSLSHYETRTSGSPFLQAWISGVNLVLTLVSCEIWGKSLKNKQLSKSVVWGHWKLTEKQLRFICFSSIPLVGQKDKQ